MDRFFDRNLSISDCCYAVFCLHSNNNNRRYLATNCQKESGNKKINGIFMLFVMYFWRNFEENISIKLNSLQISWANRKHEDIRFILSPWLRAARKRVVLIKLKWNHDLLQMVVPYQFLVSHSSFSSLPTFMFNIFNYPYLPCTWNVLFSQCICRCVVVAIGDGGVCC